MAGEVISPAWSPDRTLTLRQEFMKVAAVVACEDMCLSMQDHALIGQVRQALERAGYNRSGVMELLGDDSWNQGQGIEPADVPRFLRRCAGVSSLETLLRLSTRPAGRDGRVSQGSCADSAGRMGQTWARRGPWCRGIAVSRDISL
jgi:hypothetical protein